MMEIYREDFAKEERDEFEKYYKGIETIASGSFGTVIKAVDLKTKEEVAVKVIMKDNHNKKILYQIGQEVEILKRLDHKHIVSFKTSMETKQKMYIVMEYLRGDSLRNYLKKHYTVLTEAKAKIIIKSLLLAINYLHNRDICHRDIKPGNIMLKDVDDINSIKLVDFGLSSQFFDHKEDFDYCGTLPYMAPEQIHNKTYSKGIDIWSVGIILFKLLNEGQHPLLNPKSSKKKYLEKLKHHPIQVFKPCSNIAKSLLMKLLERNPSFRYTAQNALDHPWLNGKKYDPIPKTVFDRLKTRENKQKMIYLLGSALFMMNYQNKSRQITQEYQDKIEQSNILYRKLFIKSRDLDFTVIDKEAVLTSRPSSPIININIENKFKMSRHNSQGQIYLKDKSKASNKYKNKLINNSNTINTSIENKKSYIKTSMTTKLFKDTSRPANNSIELFDINSKRVVKVRIQKGNLIKKKSCFETEEKQLFKSPIKEKSKTNKDLIERLKLPLKKISEPKIIQRNHIRNIVSKSSVLLPKIKG